MSDGDDAKPEDDEAPAPAAEEGAEEDADSEDSEAVEEGADALADEEEEPQGLKDRLLAKWKLIVGILVAVLVLGGGGAALYFTGLLTPEKPHEVTLALPGEPVLHEMEKMVVDLKPSPRRSRPLIIMTLLIELEGQSAKLAFVTHETRVRDAIQAHLRTLTVEDLQGEAGTKRLRQDLITIVERIIRPEKVITVLYKDILIR